mgnify:CR=1 FL=1
MPKKGGPEGLSPGTGTGLGQHRLNSVQHFTHVDAFGEMLPILTFFAGALDQVADFKIEFVFVNRHGLYRPLIQRK